jgi:hypothetical protein
MSEEKYYVVPESYIKGELVVLHNSGGEGYDGNFVATLLSDLLKFPQIVKTPDGAWIKSEEEVK